MGKGDYLVLPQTREILYLLYQENRSLLKFSQNYLSVLFIKTTTQED